VGPQGPHLVLVYVGVTIEELKNLRANMPIHHCCLESTIQGQKNHKKNLVLQLFKIFTCIIVF
jgi:hypothetical protein